LGLEGLVGKRSGSRYETGKRTGAWVKIKLHQEQEFVIGGYTEPEGVRKHFGALLVGFYDGKKLKFGGRVGTGYSEKLLRTLFVELNVKDSFSGALTAFPLFRSGRQRQRNRDTIVCHLLSRCDQSCILGKWPHRIIELFDV